MTARGVLRAGAEVVRALATMTRIERALRTGDLPTTCGRLGVGLDLESAAPATSRRAVLPRWSRAPVAACTLVASCWPAGDTCLRRCLLIGHRLRELEPVLRIGVRRGQDGTFSAHSWLELGDATLDLAASRYTTLGSAGR